MWHINSRKLYYSRVIFDNSYTHQTPRSLYIHNPLVFSNFGWIYSKKDSIFVRPRIQLRSTNKNIFVSYFVFVAFPSHTQVKTEARASDSHENLHGSTDPYFVFFLHHISRTSLFLSSRSVWCFVVIFFGLQKSLSQALSST